MRWAELRDALCDIYPTSADAERVAADAYVPTRYLAFDGSCTQVWERVLREAKRRGRLLDLVRVAEYEYPDNGAVKIARVLLESGQSLRETPGEEEPVPQERRGDPYVDMMLDAIRAVRDDVRELRHESEERGEKLQRQVSELRHETRGEIGALKPMVQAHQKLFEGMAAQMKITEKRIEALEDRPETHASHAVIWIALLVGVVAALSGDVMVALVALLERWLG